MKISKETSTDLAEEDKLRLFSATKGHLDVRRRPRYQAEHLGKETERLNRTHGKQSIDYATAHFSQLRPELTDPSNLNGLAS